MFAGYVWTGSGQVDVCIKRGGVYHYAAVPQVW